MKDIPKTVCDPALSKFVADAWSRAPAYGWHLEFSVAANLKRGGDKRLVDRLQDKAKETPVH